MRSTVIRATTYEGVRTFPLDTAPHTCSRCMSRACTMRHVDPSTCAACAPMWRRRALDPEGEGVSLRFRGRVVDMTSRMVIR